MNFGDDSIHNRNNNSCFLFPPYFSLKESSERMILKSQCEHQAINVSELLIMPTMFTLELDDQVIIHNHMSRSNA